MDSPLLEPRPCPTCPGLIAGADPHRLCFECLGPDHAVEGSKHSPSCSACRAPPRLRRQHRQHRLEHFQVHYVSPDEAQDQVELEVAEEVPFVFAIPTGRAAPFVEEEEDEDFSLSGTSEFGVHEGPPDRSARQDFPLVMAMAAERVGLLLPPPPQTVEPPPSGVLWPSSASPAGLCFTPVARYLAVCGGDVAAPSEDERSGG